jgi:hypothetical protein
MPHLVLMALLGFANALALSILEGTRDIGLLHAACPPIDSRMDQPVGRLIHQTRFVVAGAGEPDRA